MVQAFLAALVVIIILVFIQGWRDRLDVWHDQLKECYAVTADRWALAEKVKSDATREYLLAAKSTGDVSEAHLDSADKSILAWDSLLVRTARSNKGRVAYCKKLYSRPSPFD